MFNIEAVGQRNEIIESVHYRRFRIIIGDFVETLLSPLNFWSVENYIQHWREQLIRFVGENLDRTFLITEMQNPKTANFIRWWVMYRVEDSVYFQEQLIFMDDIEGEFSLDSAHSLLVDRQTLNEDGDEISEWEVTFRELLESPLIQTLRSNSHSDITEGD